MSRIQKIIKRVDAFLLLLIFFAILLVGLFLYLQKIDREVRNYALYHQKIQRMISLDQGLENLFLKTFRYVNYDEISRESREFEEILDFCEHSEFKSEFGRERYEELLMVEKLYRKKADLIERFKTLNTRATNAIHYLYDLRKTIESSSTEEKEKHAVLDRMFFRLGRLLMNLPVDRQSLEKDMERLKSYSLTDRQFNNFYVQTRQFLADVQVIKKSLLQSGRIDLYGALRLLEEHVVRQYSNNRSKEESITLSFFTLAFFILLVLIYYYRKVQQTSRVLRAFRYAVENSDNSVVITDADRRIQYVNDTFEQNSGYKKEEVMGENPNILKSNLLDEDFYREMNETLDRGEKWRGELINRRKDGTLLYEKASIMPIVVNGELVRYLAIKLDITEYIETQQKLQQSAVVYEMVGDGIIITDAQKNILSVNPAFVNMFGYTEEELIGQKPIMVGSAKEDAAFYTKMWKTLMAKERWSGKIHNMTKEGKVLTIWLTITVVRNREGEIQNYIAIYTNLEEIIEMEEKADFLAYHDSLTKLPNRAQAERELADILELAKINREKMALLFIDLDRFKVINDTLGHHIGDGMLIELSQRIRKIISKRDTLARFGGDEFVVIMNIDGEKVNVSTLAGEILSAIREPIDVYGYHLHMTASIGIALYPDDGEEGGTLIKHADSAMYFAKEQGKDTYRFYTKQLSLDVQRRLDLEQELSRALERGEFSLLYQPQYELKSRKICGAEALLRWNSPLLGNVPPDQFISIAEETGMIVKIGYFVLEEACREYMRWREEGLDLKWIAVNLSSMQFREENMLKNFAKIIEKTGIPPNCLELEITERIMMEYSENNLSVIKDLREMGCGIAIDDFGTGYSSMSYLKSLELDKIKIDKSFVDDLPDDSNDVEVSTAIITLSQSLGYLVVAEGIETKAQEDFLRDQGCDYGQGYYFSMALGSDALVDFANKHS
jgi:diguanylate cyclase (GGDEF)-like protein/PAS domain S-box-containing protein